MAQIRTSQGFRAWLNGRPSSVAVALAVRSAMRVIPLIWDLRSGIDGELRSSILLPCFRATGFAAFKAVRAVSDAAGWNAEIAGGAVSAGTEAARIANRGHAAYAKAPVHAITAISSAARAAMAPRAVTDAADATSTAAYAAYAATNSAADTWRELSADCTALEGGVSSADLMQGPLWRIGRDGIGGQPDWAREAWQTLRRSLNGVNGEHWVAWTRWYQNRLDGKPLNPALEEARALIDPDL